ncbi:MAG: hypothetical protein L6R40_008549, partial [Gallowayella cf. fulva]
MSLLLTSLPPKSFSKDPVEQQGLENVMERSDDVHKVDGEAFFITNDEPYKFWDLTHANWAAAGDRTTPEQRGDAAGCLVQPRGRLCQVTPKGLGLVLATLIESLVWILFPGTKEPSLTKDKVKYSAMTRTFCIHKANARLGYKLIV